MKKAQLIRLSILLAMVLLIFMGCTEIPRDPLVDEHEQELLSVDKNLSQLEEKVAVLEANQLTAEDIRSLANLNMHNETSSNYDDDDLPQGCPSKSKLNFWFEKWQEDEITKSQYKTIENKYNSCHD